MSYITRAKIYYPKGIFVEIQKLPDNLDIIWISGEYGTWFFKSNRQHCRIRILSINQISVETIRFHHIFKYYYNHYFKNWFPLANSYLTLLVIIIKRMLIGAGVGFKKYLRVRGVGYKFELEQNKLLTAKVGYTHLVKKQLPSEFSTHFSRKAKVARFRSKSLIKITGLLAKIRSMRQPDIYKGKGIRYQRDFARRKPGKRKTKAVSKKKTVKRHTIILKELRNKKRKRKIRLKLFIKRNKW